MDAEQIVKLTPESVRGLLEQQRSQAIAKQGPGQRREERWPFPGTVEIWLPEHCYGEKHVLGTLHNLSQNGLAMRTRRPLERDTIVAIALHQPAVSCYGQAVVRHCTRASVGYLVGVEFTFASDAEAEK